MNYSIYMSEAISSGEKNIQILLVLWFLLETQYIVLRITASSECIITCIPVGLLGRHAITQR